MYYTMDETSAVVLGAPPHSFWALSLHCTHQPSRLIDSSLRQGLGGVPVGRRSAAAEKAALPAASGPARALSDELRLC